MPTGTPSQSAEQTIGAWLLMYGMDPAKADELADWLRRDGFLPNRIIGHAERSVIDQANADSGHAMQAAWGNPKSRT